jgi:hypothetical protein
MLSDIPMIQQQTTQTDENTRVMLKRLQSLAHEISEHEEMSGLDESTLRHLFEQKAEIIANRGLFTFDQKDLERLKSTAGGGGSTTENQELMRELAELCNREELMSN